MVRSRPTARSCSIQEEGVHIHSIPLAGGDEDAAAVISTAEPGYGGQGQGLEGEKRTIEATVVAGSCTTYMT